MRASALPLLQALCEQLPAALREPLEFAARIAEELRCIPLTRLLGVLGVTLLGACIWEFARRGRGTLAPIDPPKHLVVQGLYRYVRNPMYVSVTTILLGELLIVRSGALLWYCAAWLVAVNLFVIGYEEPALRRQFGDSYQHYTRTVRRWIPRVPSGDGKGAS